MIIVMEIQKMSDTQVATLVSSYEDLNQAENKYHTILAFAAVSTLPMHSATMLMDNGLEIKHESYTHPQETQGQEEDAPQEDTQVE